MLLNRNDVCFLRCYRLWDMGKKYKAAKAAHLIPDGDLCRRSICGYPFDTDLKPSNLVQFTQHVLKAHQPSQTLEAMNEATARSSGKPLVSNISAGCDCCGSKLAGCLAGQLPQCENVGALVKGEVGSI
jgi:hypothetical protein